MPRGFDKSSTNRIARTVQRTEGSHLPEPRQSNIARPNDPGVLVGKFPGGCDKGMSNLVNIYRGTTKGSETHTSGDDVTAYCRLGAVIAGKWVYVSWICGGWEAVQVEC
jgi:hypothetical protein